jgi:hypothetical protein
VALCALSWYATIALDSPILAAVTVVIGVSILYDLLRMALGGGHPPARRGGNDGYVRVDNRPQAYVIVGQDGGSVRRERDYQHTRVQQGQNNNRTKKREPVGDRNDENSNQFSSNRATTRGNNSGSSSRHNAVGSRDENENSSAFATLNSISNNVDNTLLSDGRAGVGERGEKQSSSPSYIAITASDRNGSNNNVSGFGESRSTTRNATDFSLPAFQQSPSPSYRNTDSSQTGCVGVGGRNTNPSSANDTFATLFKDSSQQTGRPSVGNRNSNLTSANTRTATDRAGVGTRIILED